jgi:hypothetical protein
MERSKSLKIAKWLAYMMFVDHKILIDVPTLMTWPNKLFDLTDEHLKIIDSYKPFFEEMEQYITIIDGHAHPTKIKEFATKFALSKGEIVQIDQYNKAYVPYNENDLFIHVTDHVGKITKERDYTSDKQILDLHSQYMGTLRDFYGFTIIDISQLNREIEDTFRAVKTELDIQPKDFKGTADLYENADIVIGLMNPYKLQVFDYGGYDITKFVNKKNYNRFRGLKVIKNSYGIDDFRIGYQFFGENGLMVELPNSDEISYEKLKNNEYINNFING